MKIVKTTCPYCGTGCGIDLCVEDNKIVHARATENHHVNDGELCLKGMFGWEFVNSPSRITTPYIRKKDGKFSKDGKLEPASYQEAFNLIASKFKDSIDKFGPNSLMGFSSARANNEDNYAFQKLFRVLGTNNIDHCARL